MSSESSRRLAILRERSRIVATVRHFFDQRGYLAVETPQLCRTPIPEAHIELFETRRAPQADVRATADVPAGAHDATDAAADTEKSLWLLPSPEYYLKRLLSEGSGSLYEITHSFRNGEEIGRYHDIEFTMLEYYTVEADSEHSLTITTELLQELGESASPLELSMQEAWGQFTGIDLAATLPGRSAENLEPRRAAMVEAIHQAGLSLSISPDDSWEDLFQRVFLTYIEPDLPGDRPVFLTDYPAAVSTLARAIAGTPWADRWELYLGGVEVANCFGEETDPERIVAFFAAQNSEKAAVGHRVHPIDRTYLRTPRLPRCSGVAMGVDRLVMHLIGVDDMQDVVSFRP